MTPEDANKIYRILETIEAHNREMIKSDATQNEAIRNIREAQGDFKSQLVDHATEEKEFWVEVRGGMRNKVDRWLFVWVIGALAGVVIYQLYASVQTQADVEYLLTVFDKYNFEVIND